jgi:putative protein kinase ArgK-like GTPase of G3E family
VLRTEANTGRGVPELWDAVERFRRHTAAQQGARRRARAEFQFRELLGHVFLRVVETEVLAAGELDGLLDRVAGREIDHHTAVQDVLARALGRAAPRP